MVKSEEGLVHSRGKGTMKDGGKQTMRYLKAEYKKGTERISMGVLIVAKD